MLSNNVFDTSFSAEKRLHHCAVAKEDTGTVSRCLSSSAFLYVLSLSGHSVSQPGVPMIPPMVIRTMPSMNRWSRLFFRGQ